MQHKELTDHIQGSFLKRQYLEAFLVQSAYIESLIKIYADFKYFIWSYDKEKEMTEDGESDKAMRKTIKKHIARLGLHDLIEFLFNANLISLEQKKLLHKYREKRNIVLHDLIKEMGEQDFENEVKKVCEIGTKLIEGEEFKQMASLVDLLEKGVDESEGDKGKEDNKEPVKPKDGGGKKTQRKKRATKSSS
jgi:hypothetical protein